MVSGVFSEYIQMNLSSMAYTIDKLSHSHLQRPLTSLAYMHTAIAFALRSPKKALAFSFSTSLAICVYITIQISLYSRACLASSLANYKNHKMY